MADEDFVAAAEASFGETCTKGKAACKQDHLREADERARHAAGDGPSGSSSGSNTSRNDNEGGQMNGDKHPDYDFPHNDSATTSDDSAATTTDNSAGGPPAPKSSNN